MIPEMPDFRERMLIFRFAETDCWRVSCKEKEKGNVTTKVSYFTPTKTTQSYHLPDERKTAD